MLPREKREELKSKRMPQDKLIVLKLGGSVVTNKEKRMTPNLGTIRMLANEVAQANKKHLIIVHGGGSFGHPLAEQYKIKEGFKEHYQIEGFSKTHQAMLKLNKLVVDALIQHNIAAFPIVPSSCIVTKTGRIGTLDGCRIDALLDMKLMPVLFGDAVMDEELGFTILSGDQLVAALATRFKAGKMILGVDVDGLCTEDPKAHLNAQLITHITLDNLKSQISNIEKTRVTDVTGGMIGKLLQLMPAIGAGIPAIIVNAGKRGNLLKALKGQQVPCTLITKE